MPIRLFRNHTYSNAKRSRRDLGIAKKYWGFFIPSTKEFPNGICIDAKGVPKPLLKPSVYPRYPLTEEFESEEDEDDDDEFVPKEDKESSSDDSSSGEESDEEEATSEDENNNNTKKKQKRNDKEEITLPKTDCDIPQTEEQSECNTEKEEIELPKTDFEVQTQKETEFNIKKEENEIETQKIEPVAITEEVQL